MNEEKILKQDCCLHDFQPVAYNGEVEDENGQVIYNLYDCFCTNCGKHGIVDEGDIRVLAWCLVRGDLTGYTSKFSDVSEYIRTSYMYKADPKVDKIIIHTDYLKPTEIDSLNDMYRREGICIFNQ